MKILAICFYYPPLNSSEGFSAYKLFSHSKHEFNIISQKSSLDWTYSNDEVYPSNATYVQTSENSSNWFKDVFMSVNWNSMDLLITRSMPNESHFLGLKIKHKYKDIKWIAFFSDPFSDSPITRSELKIKLRKLLSEKKYIAHFIVKGKSYIYNLYLRYVSKKIFKSADIIIFNNSYQRDYMIGRNKDLKSKAIVIPHTYDASFKPKNGGINGKLTFSFIGNLSEVRNLDSYLKAITKIKKNNAMADKVVFQFVGCDKKLLSEKISLGDIEYKESVSYTESLELMNKADWLINSDASITDELCEYIYLPCKLVDYFSFTSNILNISNFDKSVSKDLTEMCGGHNIKDNEDLIFNFIKNIISTNRRKTKPSPSIEKYRNDIIAKKFDSVIDDLMNGTFKDGK